MKALTFSEFGSADVLKYINIPLPEVHDGEVMVEMKAIGLNYADIYRRKGNYHLKGTPPYVAGYEGAGIISLSKSEKYNIGDRIAFADVPYSNAEYVVVPESHIIPIPDDIKLELPASVLLQGLTAQYLAEDSHAVKEKELVLIHAASGGVGQLLTQICKMKGTTVIGLTRSDAKKEIILRNKADHAINIKSDWKSQVMQITNNKGVDVVYDSVGSTLIESFDVTKECGQVVFYGMSGGDPKAVDPRMLMDSSKTLTGGDLWSYLNSELERQKRAAKLFRWILDGYIQVTPATKFPLSAGKDAHEYLESGKSSGKVLLIP